MIVSTVISCTTALKTPTVMLLSVLAAPPSLAGSEETCALSFAVIL